MRAVFRVLLPVVLSQSISQPVCAGQQNQVTIETVYNACKDRESRIKSFELSWTEKITVRKGGFTEFTPTEQKAKDVILPARDTVYESVFRLVMDGGMVRAEGKEPLTSPTEAGLQEFAWILKKGLMKSFRPKGVVSYPQGDISRGQMYDQPANSQVAPTLLPLIMVYRPFRYSGIVFDRFLSRYSVVPGEQMVSGRKCTLIKEAGDGSDRPCNMLWLDNDRDYLPVRFSRQTNDKPSIQIDYLKWRRVDSEWVPTEWRRSYMGSDGETINKSGWAVVHTHHVNHPIDGKEFTLEFPVGTWVHDARDPRNREKYILRDKGQKREITERELSGGATYEQLVNSEPGMALYHPTPDRTWPWRGIQAISVLLVGLFVALWYLRWRKRTSRTPE